ncbi:MAG: type I-MYXAN CRISPR-associated protein Cas6/Cmx6 [Gallionellaceae bacterium]
MQNRVPEMMDVSFDLNGSHLPAGYQFALWLELVRCLPWLEAEESAGIHPIRGATGGGMLLPQRAKLMLRLPAALAGKSATLSGQQIKLETGSLQVGAAKERILQPCTTLHAHLVEGAEQEDVFLDGVAGQLNEMGIACKWICGKRASINDARQKISGYSLVLHDLKPDASLQLQYEGLGGNRHFGCGIFIQYKAIAGLG